MQRGLFVYHNLMNVVFVNILENIFQFVCIDMHIFKFVLYTRTRVHCKSALCFLKMYAYFPTQQRCFFLDIVMNKILVGMPTVPSYLLKKNCIFFELIAVTN